MASDAAQEEVLMLVQQQHPRGGTRMAAMKKPGKAAAKSKPRLKSTMKKKATKKTPKKK